MTPYRLVAGAAALTLLLTACSSSSKPKASPVAPQTSAASSAPASTPETSSATVAPAAGGITIHNFAFSGTLTVKAGAKVAVTNKDTAPHTLTDKKTHLFDTGNIDGSGGAGSFTAPTKAGSYEFGCTYHSSMKGTLIVQG